MHSALQEKSAYALVDTGDVGLWGNNSNVGGT